MTEYNNQIESGRRSWLRRMLNRLEVDQAVFYALVIRGWQFLAGPVTMLLIASYFTPAIQGYFYTFASLLALQAFVELGLQGVIVYTASHEWANLDLNEKDEIVGDPEALSRLVSLGHFAFKFFAVGGGMFVVAVGFAGYLFFSQKPEATVDWIAPWLTLVLLTGGSIALIPCSALLRGCHQVAPVNRFMSIQAVAGNLVIWICIPLGANLWSAVAVAGVKLFWDAALVFVRFRRFFHPFLSRPTGSQLRWQTEIFPLQWRLALQGMFGYMAVSLFTPVLFHYHGTAAGGQMGMTWTALITLQFSAIAWVSTRAPHFGTLVSKRDFVELDRVFNRVAVVSFVVLVVIGLAFSLIVYLLHILQLRAGWAEGLPESVTNLAALISPRILPPLPTLLFALGVVLNHIPMCISIYVRAHKRDPLLLLGTISNTAIGLSVWILGSHSGAMGAACGYLAVTGLFTMPSFLVMLSRCRRAWH